LIDTYGRTPQRTASEKRYKDALALQEAERWSGAIYLGGYAIECSLKSLICYSTQKKVVTDTGINHNTHDLAYLLQCLPPHEVDAMKKNRDDKFNEARRTVLRLWKKDDLRYDAVTSHKHDCERFMDAVTVLYSFFMNRITKYRSTQGD